MSKVQSLIGYICFIVLVAVVLFVIGSLARG